MPNISKHGQMPNPWPIAVADGGSGFVGMPTPNSVCWCGSCWRKSCQGESYRALLASQTVFAWAGRVLLGSFSRSKNSFQPVFPLFFLDGSCEFDPSSVGCHSTCVDEKCLRACLEIKHGNGKIFIENN